MPGLVGGEPATQEDFREANAERHKLQPLSRGTSNGELQATDGATAEAHCRVDDLLALDRDSAAREAAYEPALLKPLISVASAH